MADIAVFKQLTSQDSFKGISKTFSTAKTAYGVPSDSGDYPLQWFMVERGDSSWSDSSTAGNLKNWFMSFGLARQDENDWTTVFNVFDKYNAKRLLVASIPQSGCGSYIDGSTVRLRVPTGSGSSEYDTFYGSTYVGYPDPATGYEITVDHFEGTNGGAMCYLFPAYDDITANARPSWGSLPYTGGYIDGANPNTGLATWTSANLTSETFYPHLKATSEAKGKDGFDIPYGIALLDRGLFIIFDSYQRPDDDYIAEYTTIYSGGSYEIWNNDADTFRAVQADGATTNSDSDNRDGIYFSGSNGIANARLDFRTVTQSYKMIYFCHAGQGEFNSTSNHTYNHRKAYFRPEEADSIYVTEIGLYDANDELLAYAKLSEPVEKSKLDTLTFKVELQL